jgi:hypothetical protein
MYANPHTHLALARARHEDMLREARQRELARLATSDRPGVLDRLRSFVASHRGAKRPLAHAA